MHGQVPIDLTGRPDPEVLDQRGGLATRWDSENQKTVERSAGKCVTEQVTRCGFPASPGGGPSPA
jgi:hypothetical protein